MQVPNEGLFFDNWPLIRLTDTSAEHFELAVECLTGMAVQVCIPFPQIRPSSTTHEEMEDINMAISDTLALSSSGYQGPKSFGVKPSPIEGTVLSEDWDV